MKRSGLIAGVIALSVFAQSAAQSQYYSDTNRTNNVRIHTIGPNRGGVIGLAVDTALYRCGQATCLKVISLNGTNFYGINVGDYIVQVNNVTFHSVDDFFGLIRENPPGTIVRIDYWDASNGLQPMNQSAALLHTQNSSYTSVDSLLPQLETIIRTDAGHWRVSRYRAGSLRDLQIASVSNDQQSYVIRGTYNYGGVWSSNYQDWVNFRFSGRDLSCIEYGHERGCRPLLREDRSLLGPVLVGVGVIAVAAIASRSGGSSGSPQPGSDYGAARRQCEQQCQRGGDPNPVTEAAMIDQCLRRCRR